jgi:hypothetical protein
MIFSISKIIPVILISGSLVGCAGLNNTQQTNYAEQTRLTNYDIVQMSQGGVSDDVIIGSIRSRGGQFDLSPEAVIILNQQKVGDKVVQYMQQHANKPQEELSTVQRATTIVTPVIQPSIIFGPRVRHHPHHGRRNHGHFSWHW